MGRRLVRPGTDFEVPTRRRSNDEKKKGDPGIRVRAEKLHEQGMPFQMAMAVALGKLEFNEALERMARSDRIDRMMVEHDLSRALATQIAMGHASIERVLYRRRYDQHREDNRDRSVLEEALRSEEIWHLGLHGKRQVEGRVVATDAYTVTAATEGVGGTETIHKLQIKYVATAADAKDIRRVMKWDKRLKDVPIQPIERPQDRYPCSDKRLFRYIDEATEVQATLLEGEVIRGRVEWFSRFEFGLVCKRDARITVFRHALYDLRDA